MVPPPFLDVPTLLESSLPRPRVGWFWYALGVFILIVTAATLLGRQSPELKQVVDFLSYLSMVALVGVLCVMTVITVRRHRAEQARLEAVAELMQLRRWDHAAMMLTQILSRPSRTPNQRSQALIYLSSVLARYHRFDDAIAVQNHLLDNDLIDAGTAHGLRLGRAMAMLREDHLFDADGAIAELRRDAGASDSAGLALVEMYRDVKTGHPAEAISLFRDRLPSLREGLGHRVADAYALAARAYDMLEQQTEATDAFSKATLLAPPRELYRRYPEVEKLAGRYPPELAPPEAA